MSTRPLNSNQVPVKPVDVAPNQAPKPVSTTAPKTAPKPVSTTAPKTVPKPVPTAPKSALRQAPIEGNVVTPIPGFIRKSCLLKCINNCEKNDGQPGSMNMLESPDYPQPLPMAPRETFENLFLKRGVRNDINDPNVDYRYNMDLTVDYEMTDTTSFASKAVPIPPSALGQTIAIPPAERRSTNEVLEASIPILPQTSPEPDTRVSYADVPLVDIIQKNYSGYSDAVKEYMSSIGKSLGGVYTTLSKNDAISAIFKDNIKIISILIAVAAGSFIVNAGFSAIVVGLILLFVTKNVSGLF